MIKLFKYFEPLWLGSNNKMSIRRALSLLFSINLVINISKIIATLEAGKSYADVGMILGIEAGLIAALLSLTTYSNAINSKQNANRSENLG
jgi:hypothetical protein